MKLTAIRKRLYRNSENQSFTEKIIQQIEPKIGLSEDTTVNDDKINKKSQKQIKKIGSQIQDVALFESIAFWQIYFLHWAVKVDSYTLMKYVSLKIKSYPKTLRYSQFNRTVRILSFALNRNNWKQINNIRSKYQALVQWSRQPESIWFPLTLALGLCFYFIVPEDFLPDFIPIIGFIDDFIAISFVIIWLAIELQENIAQLGEIEARKHIFILKLIFSFSIAGAVSAISVKLLMQIWEFFYL
ncbi:YkvA family protein [Chlorogloeopsis sp. ULAP02]|uniref:YkvA family protein n=1 Tax=Chlorogloeopsis sp. ULAP02 TaxID=3107926 RepID=UPI003136C4C3